MTITEVASALSDAFISLCEAERYLAPVQADPVTAVLAEVRQVRAKIGDLMIAAGALSEGLS